MFAAAAPVVVDASAAPNMELVEVFEEVLDEPVVEAVAALAVAVCPDVGVAAEATAVPVDALVEVAPDGVDEPVAVPVEDVLVEVEAVAADDVAAEPVLPSTSARVSP